MAIMRVEKTGNYTVMSNHHLRDHRLSLKAKGLLSVMLSLPAEWDFTLAGLSCISKEGVDAIRAAVNELEKTGYIIRSKVRNPLGQIIDMEYTIYELPQENNEKQQESKQNPTDVLCSECGTSAAAHKPVLESPMLESPIMEQPTLSKPTSGFPALENATQISTDILSTDTERKDIKSNESSNPNQSSTYPSDPETVEQIESVSASKDAITSPYGELQTTVKSSSIQPAQSAVTSVQQLYMSEETSLPGVRRRLSFDEFVRKVKHQIGYWDLIEGKHRDEIDNILSIMLEVLSTQCEFFTISGKKYPADLVHQRYTQINANTIEYILECLHNCGSNIRNIKQYMIAALFNAPATCDSYYGAAVRRDYAFMRG